MSRRRIGTLLGALALSVPCAAAALPAQAAEVKPLSLTSTTLGIWAPATEQVSCTVNGCTRGPVVRCTYSEFNCGVVVVKATFGGLDGRSRTGYVYVTGTAKVKETYGCRSADGTRLSGYDTVVKVTDQLTTRRQMPSFLLETGDTFTVTLYGPLDDNQPGGCPAGTQPMLYAIRATTIKVELTTFNADIPAAHYPVPGTVVWTGAAPTPTG